MKATLPWMAALVGSVLAASLASAQPNYYPALYRISKQPIPPAPDMLGPGFYVQCPNNVWYGPNYCVKPPFLPFQGALPGPQGKAIEAARMYAPYHPNFPRMDKNGGWPGQPAATHNAFPTHPYARSPRDFFMWREVMEDQAARGSRPSLVP